MMSESSRVPQVVIYVGLPGSDVNLAAGSSGASVVVDAEDCATLYKNGNRLSGQWPKAKAAAVEALKSLEPAASGQEALVVVWPPTALSDLDPLVELAGALGRRVLLRAPPAGLFFGGPDSQLDEEQQLASVKRQQLAGQRQWPASDLSKAVKHLASIRRRLCFQPAGGFSAPQWLEFSRDPFYMGYQASEFSFEGIEVRQHVHTNKMPTKFGPDIEEEPEGVPMWMCYLVTPASHEALSRAVAAHGAAKSELHITTHFGTKLVREFLGSRGSLPAVTWKATTLLRTNDGQLAALMVEPSQELDFFERPPHITLWAEGEFSPKDSNDLISRHLRDRASSS